ncbi:methyltransferase domain-containing protein [Chitinivibrio alkaliphilus]|uniref:Malonyl-CoA O-methyltransferase n=1 Tax=Chitinivibrio alkaliphilus ACht1 TaxID=1313304 RepID=U7D9B1_9BACT|nr:methyltransferase domain-containing protein [Chitinivibrio alkaliphilus]ERP38979.1 malonyl-CoA O-methyltransferase [Chitinivibrio alkaliphilus ACht1]
MTPRQRISRFFSRKSHSYATYARVQQAAIDDLISHQLQEILPHIPSGPCLDLGSGPGVVSEALYRHNIPLRPILLDIAYDSLLRAAYAEQCICASMDTLPLSPRHLALLISSTALHWAHDPTEVLKQACTLVQPGGYLVVNNLGDTTLQALRETQREFNLSPPVRYFTPEEQHHILASLGTVTSHTIHAYEDRFSSPAEALRSLSEIGATTHTSPPLSRARLMDFLSAYGRRARRGRSYINRYTYIRSVVRL